MFTAKNLLLISLPGLLLAALLGYWFLLSDVVPLWLVMALLGQALLLAWWRSKTMRAILLEDKPKANFEEKHSICWAWLWWLGIVSLLFLLGVTQSDAKAKSRWQSR